jgi:diketogulonate reductase-like aldo/keto reductase
MGIELTNTYKKLNNGITIPEIGFGTYHLEDPDKCTEAVLHALHNGYRLIDTAAVYQNEGAVGKAIAQSGIPRDHIFLTTKLWQTDHGYKNCINAFERSSTRLNLDYVDLYLIHWPDGGKLEETWDAMEELYNKKKCKAIGVSNFQPSHIESLLTHSSIPPAVNQIKWNAFSLPRETAAYCFDNSIEVEAYSPLAKARRLDDPRLTEIADTYKKSSAQVMLRWLIQHGAIPIPKSSTPARIEHNIDIFDFVLTDKDMRTIDNLE